MWKRKKNFKLFLLSAKYESYPPKVVCLIAIYASLLTIVTDGDSAPTNLALWFYFPCIGCCTFF